MVPFAGWEMPVTYEGIREEHSAVRTHAGMFDVSHMGEVEIEGPGALAFLQRVLSNDVSAIDTGSAQYSCLCDEDGGVLDDLFAYRLGGDRYLLVTNSANHETDLAWLGRWSRDFDVSVRDVADRYAMLAVQGPNARGIVARTLGIELPARMRVATVRIGSRPALACGTGYTGEDGVELLIDPEVAPAIWAELLDAGVVPCGLGARDTLRLEVCFHLHGNDLTPERNPIEAGLGWCCVEATGFVGSEAIARVRRNGPTEKLVPFKVEGPGIPRPGLRVLRSGEGESIGLVTSGTFSPSLEVGIGMAYVRADLAEPGTEVEIDVRGKRRPARIASKPLYRKEK
jgi:glycine cleavage system T protein (aminomethyltransferase)